MALQMDQIRALAERVAASHHLELVDLEFGGGGKSRALRVFVEKDLAERKKLAERVAFGEVEGTDELPALPKGVPVELLSGVTHEDCSAFATDFGTLLDVEDVVPGAEYTLEVSSPGLERKLSRAEDFEAPVVGGCDKKAAPGQPAPRQIGAKVAGSSRSGIGPVETVALGPAVIEGRGALPAKPRHQLGKAPLRHVEMQVAVHHARRGPLVGQAPFFRRMRSVTSVVRTTAVLRIAREQAPLRHGPLQLCPAGFHQPEAGRRRPPPRNARQASGNERGRSGLPSQGLRYGGGHGRSIA